MGGWSGGWSGGWVAEWAAWWSRGWLGVGLLSGWLDQGKKMLTSAFIEVEISRISEGFRYFTPAPLEIME